MSLVHLHLALNHVPVLGVAVGAALLLWALWRGDASLRKGALVALAVSAALAPVVSWTGEGAEEILERFPGWSEALIERHEEAAEAATWACAALAAAALWALRGFGRRPEPDRRSAAAALLALACVGLLARAAYRGGQIRHSEIDADWKASAPEAEPR
jgi:hypothetical protein